METLRKLTHDLLELRYKIPTDDNVATERQMQSWIRQQRSIWVSNELNKNRFEPAYWQETGVISLEDFGNDLKISQKMVPPFIQVNHRPAVLRVYDGTPLGKEYPWALFQDVKYLGNRRFDAKTIFSYFVDNRLILKRPVDDIAGTFDPVLQASIVGIFEDPMDLKIYNRADGTPVYHEDLPYPIHLKLYTYMREQILKVNFPVEAQSTQDIANDSTAQE